MIHESYPWKRDLMRRRSLIIKYNTAKHLEQDDDSVYTIIEKAIFYSAFIIRKLIDCPGKVSDEVDQYRMEVEVRSPLKKVDIVNRYLDEKSHDWNHSYIKDVAAKNICNWLIHSFIFVMCTADSGDFEGFFVASDYDKNKFLYYVKLSDWLSFIDFVATDSVVSTYVKYDEKKEERIFISKRRA